jgi:hypothetical protein
MTMADNNSPPTRKDRTDPAGGDLPRRFYDEQPYKVEVSDQLLKTNRELAERNLEVAEHNFDGMLTQLMEYVFETSKQNAMKSPELAREMDDLVRSIFHDQPDAMAQWEEFIQTCAIADEEIEDA